MFCALDRLLRRQRRRVVMLAATLVLAGAVVTAHSMCAQDHMDDAFALCLAVVESAVVTVGGVVALALVLRPRWLSLSGSPYELALAPFPAVIRSRAGPRLLQVFRF